MLGRILLRHAAMLTLGLSLSARAGVPIPAFIRGDIYLASNAITGSSTRGIVRVNPVTFASSPVITFAPTDVPGFHGRVAYDPLRDRLVLPDSTTALTLINAAGFRTPLPYTWTQTAYDLATTRDGRIYMTSTVVGPAIPRLAYIDAGGVTHQVLNAAGSDAYFLNVGIDAILYDTGTNSLIAAIPNGSPSVLFRRLSLNAAGDRVLDDSLTSTFVVSTAGPRVQGLSRGPTGLLFAKVDDNSGDTVQRMLLVNPATLAVSAFASSGYFGVGGEMAGCYSSVDGAAIVLDTLGDVLRRFTMGSSGAGTTLPTMGVSGSGSGENAQLIEIGSGVGCPGDANGDGHIDFIDLNIVLSQFGMTGAGLAGDFDHDGDVDFVDLNVVLSAFGSTC